MTRRLTLFWMLAVFAGSGLQAGETEEMEGLMRGLDDTQLIQKGDFLSLQIRKMGLEKSVVRVENEGDLKPPFLEPMKATELTCRATAYHIKRELEKNYLCGTQWVLVKFSSSQECMELLDDKQVIQAGDKIGWHILEAGQKPAECVVAKDGRVQVRDLGPVQAAGMTCKKLALFISQKLAALPADRLSYTYSGAPTVVIAFEVVQATKAKPMIPPGFR